jgi:hypothetical protein
MTDKIKLAKAYSAAKSEPGKRYDLTEFDKRCVDIAVQFSEEELRGATVIRAALNRKSAKKL